MVFSSLSKIIVIEINNKMNTKDINSLESLASLICKYSTQEFLGDKKIASKVIEDLIIKHTEALEILKANR